MMKGLIDIHCHILPGLDDGVRDMEEALAMARAAYQAGISEIIATPHFEEGVFENYRETIVEEVEKFRKELEKNNIPIKIHPGCEIMLTPNIIPLLKEGKLMTMKDEGKYVLVELPRTMWPLYTEDIIFELKVLGLTPIIAHPERYRELNEDIIRENIVQFNIGTLVGLYGSRAQGRLEKLIKLKEQQEIIYGTDLHRVENEIFNCNYLNLLKGL